MKKNTYLPGLLFLALSLALTLAAARSGRERADALPTLAEVETLSSQEATERLSGQHRRDLLSVWGQPRRTSAALTRTLADLYDAEERGGWVIVQYETSAPAQSLDPGSAEGGLLRVKRVEVQTVG